MFLTQKDNIPSSEGKAMAVGALSCFVLKKSKLFGYEFFVIQRHTSLKYKLQNLHHNILRIHDHSQELIVWVER